VTPKLLIIDEVFCTVICVNIHINNMGTYYNDPQQQLMVVGPAIGRPKVPTKIAYNKRKGLSN
jgi:hypothetical protein